MRAQRVHIVVEPSPQTRFEKGTKHLRHKVQYIEQNIYGAEYVLQ